MNLSTIINKHQHQKKLGTITSIFIYLCCAFFLLSEFIPPTVTLPHGYANLNLITSPIDQALLYDYPSFYERLENFIKLYGFEALEEQTNLPSSAIDLLEQIKKTAFWQGAYPILIKGGLVALEEAWHSVPVFEKIRSGQYWRLFSPCLLHGDILHLFFNMTWLFVLGKEMEACLSPWRYIFFILLCGSISNTAQYLVSGANFIGFSGVLCGMLAFIWMRQRLAPWEGYQMDQRTFMFMFIFVVGLAGVQTLLFILQSYFNLTFYLNIANMAHISGGITGVALGRLSFFKWRPV